MKVPDVWDEVDLAELRATAEAAAERSPGQWFWSGSIGRRGTSGGGWHNPYLACMSPGLGRCVVMGFARLGMRDAQPRFPAGERRSMVHGRDLAIYEVPHRADIVGFDAPEAAHMAAASPSVVVALLDRIEELERELAARPS